MGTILCLHGFGPAEQEKIRRAAPGRNIVFGRTADIGPDVYRDAEVICGWNARVEELCLGEGSKLRWVQTWSAGIDSLPLGRLRERGVLLTDAAGVHSIAVAETAFAHMLGLTRGIHLAVRSQIAGAWERPSALTELYGKTALIVGAGAIGTRIAELARAFGMRTIGIRRTPAPHPAFDRVAGLDGLDAAIAESDYVVNVLPDTPETRGLFDEARIGLMKPTAFFVNVGRGSAVVTDALVKALRDRRIAGAGLDVFEEEPLPAGHPLWELDNVILTPHTAGHTDRLKERVADLFAANLAIYLRGETDRLINLVDYGRGY
ncbi:MAG: hydroxyacid dehydrogenase [Thermobacillus sp. ZCTH02-B1]|uniref:D-2-hydroxyacid dehydrogenase n=1 Tax=Thermobacillus sp. ZCTH02-B1 TaxID=1858795 RepID=UPI000B55F274|nr:D-2-hydroxyacid dehydrogenase [Thermobacillus sp. ZCTH02-B1]OUM95308.1 MAG: hydroxyacid dehydrogenase [Thermobacillus sp. ZCTH02-B1]